LEFAQSYAFSDVCVLCADVERSIRFYVLEDRNARMPQMPKFKMLAPGGWGEIRW
jgi:hypothetical protein